VLLGDHVNGQQVQLRTIAASLRFADELAEGPQRNERLFSGLTLESNRSRRSYHRYASCTNVSADRGNERIRLTYEIQINEFASSEPGAQLAALTEFLAFVFQRIAKLDEERRYARFYCPALAPFKQTDVAINFYNGSTLVPPAARFQLG